MIKFLLAITCVAFVLPAQTQNIIYHDSPSSTNGVANAFPFGSQGVRTQQLIPQSVLGATPAFIQDLFVNPQIATSTTYTTSQVYYGDFEIRMGITQLATLTNTWAMNSPNETTVYRGPLLVRFVRDQWIPLGLPVSYLWLPLSPADNLVVDFICWQVINTGSVPPTVNGYFLNSHSSATNSISRAYRLNWAASQPTTSAGVDGYGIKLGFLMNDGNFISHDGSCAGSSTLVPAIGATPGTWPQIGLSFDVHLTQGPPNLLAALALGFSTTSFGPLLLPFDMGLVGAPGCTLWSAPEAILPLVATDPSGGATFTLPFPNNPTLSGVRVHGTWLCIDPAANSFAIVPSGFATMIL